jgi:2'-5' RNA ligase
MEKRVAAERRKAKPLYFLALLLPAALTAEITSLKKTFAARYGPSHALKLIPHITLVAPFRLSEVREGALEASVEAFLQGRKTFPVSLSGFGSFRGRGGATLFIQADGGTRLDELHEGLQRRVDQVILPPETASRPFRPHVTLANRDLDREVFSRAWPEYQDRDFTATFEADVVCLLRHDGKSWQQLKRYVLG